MVGAVAVDECMFLFLLPVLCNSLHVFAAEMSVTAADVVHKR